MYCRRVESVTVAKPLNRLAQNVMTTLAGESFGRLGEEGYDFINELATHIATGTEGSSMA